MSETTPETTSAGAFREVRGAFPNSDAMQDAVGRLSVSGFDRADMTLPTETELSAADTDVDAQQLRTLHASTAGTAAALAAAGVTVATGGAAGPAVAAALAAGGVIGGGAYAAEKSSNNSEQESRDERALDGDLILAVRTPTAAKQAQAADILRAAGANQVLMFNQEI